MGTDSIVARAGVALVIGLTVASVPLFGCSPKNTTTGSKPSSDVAVEQSLDAGSDSSATRPVASEVIATASAGRKAMMAKDVASATPSYADGVYEATASGGKFGDVSVSVTIRGGAITAVTVGDNHESAPMAQKAQSVVIPQILETQSVEDIDVATGATQTSEAIIEAVRTVLARASA